MASNIPGHSLTNKYVLDKYGFLFLLSKKRFSDMTLSKFGKCYISDGKSQKGYDTGMTLSKLSNLESVIFQLASLKKGV